MIATLRLFVCAALAAAALTPLGAEELTDDGGPRPDPSLSPREVVRIQMEALGRNAELPRDGGIRIAYRFASPANRASTGPLERFIRMVKGPVYRVMLDYRGVEYGTPVVKDDRALVPVALTTPDFRRIGFLFVLSRYTLEDCDGCWLTDAVHRVADAPARSAPRRVL